MSKVCEVCGKKPMRGNSISHAHNRNPRRFMPNLQRIRAFDGRKNRRMTVCTRCIRSGKVAKARPVGA